MKPEIIEAQGSALSFILGQPEAEVENTVVISSWQVTAGSGVAEFPQVLRADAGTVESQVGSSGLVSSSQEIRATAGRATPAFSKDIRSVAISEPRSVGAVGYTGETRLVWDQAARTVSFTASVQTGLHGLGISGEGSVVEIELHHCDATSIYLERQHEVEIETRAVDYLFYELEVGG